jgi:hypothetical protein
MFLISISVCLHETVLYDWMDFDEIGYKMLTLKLFDKLNFRHPVA